MNFDPVHSSDDLQRPERELSGKKENDFVGIFLRKAGVYLDIQGPDGSKSSLKSLKIIYENKHLQ